MARAPSDFANDSLLQAALVGQHVLPTAVIGVPDERWGEAVKGVVVLRPGAKANSAELIEHCGLHIAGYKKPKSVDFVDDLPVLASGKVDKVALREKFGRRES
jgi:acyl-CoA synthetase (AMP-forming)/AMP-acid ligase II